MVGDDRFRRCIGDPPVAQEPGTNNAQASKKWKPKRVLPPVPLFHESHPPATAQATAEDPSDGSQLLNLNDNYETTSDDTLDSSDFESEGSGSSCSDDDAAKRL